MVISFGNFVAENRQDPLSSIKRDPDKLLPLPSPLYNFVSRLWNLVAFSIPFSIKCTVYYAETDSMLLAERETRDFRFFIAKENTKNISLFDDDIIIRLQ